MVRINLVAVWVLALGLVAYAEPPSQSYGAPAAAQPVFRQASAPQSQYGAPQQQQQYSAPAPQQAPQQYSAPAPAPQSSYGSPAPQQHHAPAPQQYNAPEEQAPQEGGKIHKHVYVHVAPDEEPEFRAQRPKKPAPAPEKHYKILFIKAPSASPGGDEEIQLPPAPETKTLVYVLLKKPEFAGASTSPLLLQPNPANPKSTSSVTRGEIRTREVKGGTTPLPHKKLHNNIMPQLPSRLPSSTMLLLHNNIMLQPHNRLHNNTTHPPPNPAMVHQLPNNTALRPHNNNNNTALQLPNNTTLQPHSRLHNNTMPPHLSPATVHQPHNNTTPLLPNKPLNNTTHPPHNVSNNLRSTELPSLLVMHDIRKDILDTASTDIQLYKQQWKGVAAAIFSFFDAITCSTTTLSPPSKQLISTYIFVPVLLFQTMKCIIFIPCTM
ncbi:hypothetical protein Fcan01_13555 [Folsomia candida]|uniref:DUF243 domain-containing protein n=1 Tax=Folsomia candida TaxID=158441 RepID=A0A226E2T3_FOLCA|nr:hypothetical protein Fcan01_13555 [Folsomia candida]